MRILFLFTLVLGCFSLSAQNYANLHTKSKKSIAAYKQAELLQQQRRYNEAINLLDQVIQKDPTFVEAYFKAGGLFYAMGNKYDAKQYFCKGADIVTNEKAFAGAYFTAGELCYLEGEYENAKKYFQRALEVQPNDKKILDQTPMYLRRCDFALEQMKHPLPFDPVKLPPVVNAYYVHSHPVISADQKTLVYTVRSGVANNDDENIVMTKWNGKEWSTPVSISDKINSTNNEGTCSMSLDGSILVFVGCSRKDGFGSCDLYISKKVNGEWTVPVNMGDAINSSAWDSHPSLSPDGRVLYFTSGRAGGLGKEDIYVSYMKEDGTWTKAKNVGLPINSPGSETSPFIHPSSGRLYFSSNFHLGMGGEDVFYSNLTDTAWSEPVNLGYPINTNLNDGTMFITIDNQKGYYSRYDNQNNYMSRVFLYEFSLPDAIKPSKISTYAQGHIYDKSTKAPLGATIELIDLSTGKVIQKVSSDGKTGEYTLVITEGKEYGLFISKEGYLFESLHLNYKHPASFNPLSMDAYLSPIKSGENITLNNIFFAFNSTTLEEKSLTELKKLVDLMQKNPTLKVELSGHTDNVGSDASNKALSLNRAKAVYDYLVSQGIDSKRLLTKGQGAAQPVADNTTEEGRAKNRRLEVKVL